MLRAASRPRPPQASAWSGSVCCRATRRTTSCLASKRWAACRRGDRQGSPTDQTCSSSTACQNSSGLIGLRVVLSAVVPSRRSLDPVALLYGARRYPMADRRQRGTAFCAAAELCGLVPPTSAGRRSLQPQGAVAAEWRRCSGELRHIPGCIGARQVALAAGRVTVRQFLSTASFTSREDGFSLRGRPETGGELCACRGGLSL